MVIVKEPKFYKLSTFAHGERDRYEVSLNGDTPLGFTGNDRSYGAKIYLIERAKAVKYIGRTIQRMSQRFSASINGKKYTWSASPSSSNLLIWDFVGLNEREIEAIEAEFTLAIRVYQKGWPVDQTSINFRWVYETKIALEAQKIAIEMLKQFAYFEEKNNIRTNEEIKEDLSRSIDILTKIQT
ncbi:hypothetical protein [Pseudocolwellia agarivorans]|uniref:hypothetical protein n=1 Tax=Pseudocolwellia agarivorans TaxID=1911682 RepID=UPI003F881184